MQILSLITHHQVAPKVHLVNLRITN